MALAEKREALVQFIKQHSAYLQHNHNLFKVHEGQLAPLVIEDMRKSFSAQYFSTIEGRLIFINILRRYIDKVSKAYATDPIRTTTNERYQETLAAYEKCFDMNTNGTLADRWGNLFKGYAWEIFHHKGKPRLRTIPFDRFMVYSDDAVDPMSETVFIKIMGKVKKDQATGAREVDFYYAYTETEFDAFDSDGDAYLGAEVATLGGVNPYGVIPFVYGNRSLSELIPTQDTDILPMTKVIPILASDLSGAIMYQAFSIIYGIDVKESNLKIAPNTFWSLKSEEGSDNTPVVGTIKPSVDIGAVVSFVMTMFAFWLETKGVRVGSVGNVDGANFASGIAKMIDEMDTYEIQKESIKFFQNDEQELWEKVRVINNYWLQNNVVDGNKYGLSLLLEDFDVTVEFDEPAPMQSRADQIGESAAELRIKTTIPEFEIKRLHPDWPPEKVAQVMKFWEQEVYVQEGIAEVFAAIDGDITTNEQKAGQFAKPPGTDA
jgi:hypothetical protein